MSGAEPFLIMSAVSAASSLASGFGQAGALSSQAKAAEFRAKGYELQASQVSAERATELNDVLSTIDGIRSFRNVSLDSPTAMVIERERKKRHAEVTNAEVLSIRQGAVAERHKAKEAKRARPFAILGGIGQAASSLAGAFPGGG